MDIWLSKASGPLHVIHLGYGAGSFIVPQIVKHFIRGELPNEKDAITNPACIDRQEVTNVTNGTTTASLDLPPSETLQYGFIIVSFIILAAAVIWFLYFFFDKKQAAHNEVVNAPKDKKSIREIFDLNTCAPGQPFYAFILYVFLFLWTYTAVVGERVFAKYLYSYAREQACFDVDESADILTAFWISFTAGRFAGFMIANFIPMKYIIFIEGIGNFASALVLYFYARDNRYVLWACVCISGILIGPCYPSGLSWVNRYMVVTATGVTVLSVGAGVSDLSFLSTIGYFAEKFGISVMTTFVLGHGVVVCVLPIIMQSVAHFKGDRFEQEDEQKSHSK